MKNDGRFGNWRRTSVSGAIFCQIIEAQAILCFSEFSFLIAIAALRAVPSAFGLGLFVGRRVSSSCGMFGGTILPSSENSASGTCVYVPSSLPGLARPVGR